MKIKFIYGKKSRILNLNFFLVFALIVLALLPFGSQQGAETDYVIGGNKVYK